MNKLEIDGYQIQRTFYCTHCDSTMNSTVDMSGQTHIMCPGKNGLWFAEGTNLEVVQRLDKTPEGGLLENAIVFAHDNGFGVVRSDKASGELLDMRETIAAQAAEIQRLRGLLSMYLKYNDDYGLSGTDMRRMLDNIWLPKVRAELEQAPS